MHGTALNSNRHVLMMAALVTLVASALVLAAVRHREMRALDTELDDRLTITRHAVVTEIERFRYLPALIGEDARVVDLLHGTGSDHAVNDYLKTVRSMSGVDEIYLLNTAGRTLAASNWDEPGSFVGQDYAFRPYFSQALQTGEGRYYAVGVTTGKPGYFLSARIGPKEAPMGIAVAKVDMTALESAWVKANEAVALADALGVVFLSGRREWCYRPRWQLDADAQGVLEAERRYAGLDIPSAPPLLTADGRHGEDDPWMRFHELPVDPDGWRVIAAGSEQPGLLRAALWAGVTALAGGLASGGALLWRQRRQIVRMRLEQAGVLERRVAERTEELAREIEIRRRTEEDLRTTHASLVHAAKLAVMGRMSSTIVHEVSQPLAAMDSTLAAAELHLGHGAPAKAANSLASTRELLRRLQDMVRTLKRFGARQKLEPPAPVSLAATVATAQEVLSPRLRDLGVGLRVDLGDLPAVAASPAQLQQVMTNLILNAAEATARARSRAPVEVSAQVGPRLTITIADRGPGIPEDLREKVFEPFFTTRITGEGLGLGLSIVRSILDHMGAGLAFRPRDGGGTLALLDLPLFARETTP